MPLPLLCPLVSICRLRIDCVSLAAGTRCSEAWPMVMFWASGEAASVERRAAREEAAKGDWAAVSR